MEKFSSRERLQTKNSQYLHATPKPDHTSNEMICLENYVNFPICFLDTFESVLSVLREGLV